MEIYVCAYGNDQAQEKGIIQIDYDFKQQTYKKKTLLTLEGKANMVVITSDHLYVSEERPNGNYLVTCKRCTGEKQKESKVEHFYSYGYYHEGLLYLASFTDGVDSVFDCEKQTMLTHKLHKDESGKSGRSHYIHAIEENHFIAVDNGFQKIYFYKNAQLDLEKVLSFEDINVRLLSKHPSLPYAYVNTEITNEVIVLDLDKREVESRVQMTQHERSFSGGNAIDENGTLLVISVRGENKIYIYKIEQGKTLQLKTSFHCGMMPRDLLIKNNTLFVSCTDENVIEVYDLKTYEKITSIPIYRPITFGMQ